jgi:hypothetical protein
LLHQREHLELTFGQLPAAPWRAPASRPERPQQVRRFVRVASCAESLEDVLGGPRFGDGQLLFVHRDEPR